MLKMLPKRYNIPESCTQTSNKTISSSICAVTYISITPKRKEKKNKRDEEEEEEVGKHRRKELQHDRRRRQNDKMENVEQTTGARALAIRKRFSKWGCGIV